MDDKVYELKAKADHRAMRHSGDSVQAIPPQSSNQYHGNLTWQHQVSSLSANSTQNQRCRVRAPEHCTFRTQRWLVGSWLAACENDTGLTNNLRTFRPEFGWLPFGLNEYSSGTTIHATTPLCGEIETVLNIFTAFYESRALVALPVCNTPAGTSK
jgi:hypothetical protein